MKILYNISVFFLLLGSCSEGENIHIKNSAFPQILDTVTFEFPFNPNHGASGSFIEDGKSYFYFGNAVSFKKLVLYDADFKCLDTVSLKAISQGGFETKDLQMISRDSIVVLTTYTTGRLLLLNRKGEIIKNITINERLTNTPFGQFEFDASYNGDFYANGRFLFFLSPLVVYLEDKYKQLSSRGFSKKYYTLKNEAPICVAFQNVFNDSNFTYSLVNQLPSVEKTAKTLFRPALTYCELSGDAVYFFSVYEPEIVKYSFNKKEHSVYPWDSEYTKNGVQPLRIDYFDIPNFSLQDSVNRIAPTSAQIYRFFHFNKKNHLFIHHARTMQQVKKAKQMSWSWKVYDENFKPIKEKKFSSKDLISGFSFHDHKLMYILINDYEKEDYTPLKKRFVRFLL